MLDQTHSHFGVTIWCEETITHQDFTTFKLEKTRNIYTVQMEEDKNLAEHVVFIIFFNLSFNLPGGYRYLVYDILRHC